MYYVNCDFAHRCWRNINSNFHPFALLIIAVFPADYVRVLLHMTVHMSKPHETNCSLRIFLLVAFVSAELHDSFPATCVHLARACGYGILVRNRTACSA
jgi:hypothetical protein